MGVFSKHDQQSISSSETTIIANGARIEGVLKFQTRLHIDGEVQGEIISQSIVTVGSSGKVYGNIKARKLIINGFVDGSIECDSVELLKGGTFSGKVSAKELMVEAKAVFNAQSKMIQDKEKQSVAS